MPSQLNSSLSQEPDSTVLSDNTPKLDSLVSGRNSSGSDTSGRDTSAKSEPNGNVKSAESELSFHDFLPEEQNVTGPKQTKASSESKQKNSSQNGQQRGKSSSEGNGNSGNGNSGGNNSGSNSGSNKGRGKGRSQRNNDGDSGQGNGNSGHGNKKSNGRKNNNKGRNNQKQAHKAQPQDVDGNRDPDCVGEVGTSLNLTLSKALMVKLKRQAKSEGVSMEALATELISEGAVLRAWEIVERKGHLRDASANQSGNSYGGNGNGGNQRRGNGNRQQKNGNGNGNSRNMNKQRYNAIMDDKANFLEYVRNQEKYNR